MRRNDELVVITKTYDLILWSCNHTSRFPRNHRFVLGERIERLLYELLETLIEANVYLDPLDHFLRDRLRVAGYVRYVDDFLVFSDDKRHLADVRDESRRFLATLRLRLHPDKTVIFPSSEGIRFLGYRVFPTHRLLAKENVRRFRKRVKRLQTGYARGVTSAAEIRQRLMSWSGHAAQADSYRLRRRLFATIRFQRATAVKPRAAWRLVQQQRTERALGEPQHQPAGQP